MQVSAAVSMAVALTMSWRADAAPCTEAVSCAKACSPRDPAACTRAAEAYFNGSRVRLDPRKSFALAKTACDAGDASGCGLLGAHYQDGFGSAWDPARAVEIYDKACRRGSGLACFNLAGMYGGGHGVTLDDDKHRAYRTLAVQQWQTACSGGDLTGCTPLAALIDEDGDTQGAQDLLKRACDHGQRGACVESLRRGLVSGTIPPDAFVQAIGEQCRAGEAHGCGVLGAMLLLGRHGVARDIKRGIALEKRACELGSSEGCAGVGSMYAPGGEVAQDMVTAVRYFEMACDRRLARACLNVAQLHASQNHHKRAIDLARRGCQMNNADACALVATTQLAANHRADGLRWATEACRMGRGDLCGVLIERDLELPVPSAVKLRLYSEACQSGLAAACKHVTN